MVGSIEMVFAKHGKAQKWYFFCSCLYALRHCSVCWTMSSETFSVIVWFWHDQLTNATQLKVVRVDTSEEVRLTDGSFLLRISRDGETSVERCLIRHISSGREAYIQSGPNLRAFVKACLLNNDESAPDAPGE